MRRQADGRSLPSASSHQGETSTASSHYKWMTPIAIIVIIVTSAIAMFPMGGMP